MSSLQAATYKKDKTMARKKSITPEEFTSIMACVMAASEEPLGELDLSLVDFDPMPDGISDLSMLAGPSKPAPDAPSSIDDTSPISGTQRITIRVSRRVLRAFKSRAKKSGTRYQTLMNRALRTAVETHP